MEEIEYLEEYEDLVLSKAINSAAVAASKAPQPQLSDEDSSSSLDQDIFNCLFDDNSDDDEQQPKNDETNVNYKRTSRPSVDSIDLLTDLGEQVAKEFELKKDITAQQSQKSYSLTKSATKAQPKASSTPRPKTYSVKNSGTKTPLPNRTSQSTVKTKSVATVRPVQNKELQKKTASAKESSLGQIRQLTSLASHTSCKINSTKTLLPVRTSKTLETGTSILPSSSNVNKSAATLSLKSTFVKQRPATIVKPEKIVTKDPPEDPLNLDDLSSSESENYSVSDISGETYNSISDFDDDDYDFTSHIENLDEEDDESSNSQVIDISNDSSGSRFQFEDLRAATPSPVVSDDRDLSSTTNLKKQRPSSPKLMANHEIIKSLLCKGEKPKLLQLITEYDTADNMDTKGRESTTNTGPMKTAVGQANVTSPPNDLSNKKATELITFTPDTQSISPNTKDQEDFTNTCANTMDYPTNSRDTQSPGTISHDSYLSVVNEMLEESYAEAMKSSKHDGLSNQEVGAEMEIGVEEIADVYMCRDETFTCEGQTGRTKTEHSLEKHHQADVRKIEALDEESTSETKQRKKSTQVLINVNESTTMGEKNVSAEKENETEKSQTMDFIDVNKKATDMPVESMSDCSVKKKITNVTKPAIKDLREDTLDDENGFEGFHDDITQKLPNTSITKSVPKEEHSGGHTTVKKVAKQSAVENKSHYRDEEEATTSKLNTNKYSSTTFKSPSKTTDQSKEKSLHKDRSREKSYDRSKETSSKYLLDGPKVAIRNPFVQRTVHKNLIEEGAGKSAKDHSRERSGADRSRENSKDRGGGSNSKKELKDDVSSKREAIKKTDSKEFKGTDGEQKVKHSNITIDKEKKKEKESKVVESTTKDVTNSIIRKQEAVDKKPLSIKPPKTHLGKSSDISKTPNISEGSKKYTISKESKAFSSLSTESNKKSGLTSNDYKFDGKHKDIKNPTKCDNQLSSPSSRESSKERKVYKKSLASSEKSSKSTDKNSTISSDSISCGESKPDLKQSGKSIDVLKTPERSKESNPKNTTNVIPNTQKICKPSFENSNELDDSNKKKTSSGLATKAISLEQSNVASSSSDLYQSPSKAVAKITENSVLKASPKGLKKTRSGAKTANPMLINTKKEDKPVEIKGTDQKNQKLGFEKEKPESKMPEGKIRSTVCDELKDKRQIRSGSEKSKPQEEFKSTHDTANKADAKMVKVISKEEKKSGEIKANKSVHKTPQKATINEIKTSNNKDKEVGTDNTGSMATVTTKTTPAKDQIMKTTKNVIFTTEMHSKVMQECRDVEYKGSSDSSGKSQELHKPIETTKHVDSENQVQMKEEEDVGESTLKLDVKKFESDKNIQTKQVDSAKQVQIKNQEDIGDNANKLDVEENTIKPQISRSELKSHKNILESIIDDSMETKNQQTKFKKILSREVIVYSENKNEDMKKEAVEANKEKEAYPTLKETKSVDGCKIVKENTKTEICHKSSDNQMAKSTEGLDLKLDGINALASNSEDNSTKEEAANVMRITRNTKTDECITSMSCNPKCFSDESLDTAKTSKIASETSLINTKDIEDAADGNNLQVTNRKTRSTKLDDSYIIAVEHKKETNEHKKEPRIITTIKKMNPKVVLQKTTSLPVPKLPQINTKEPKYIAHEISKTTDIRTEDFDKDLTLSSDIGKESGVTTPQKNTRKTRSAHVYDDATDDTKSIAQSKWSKEEDTLSKPTQKNLRKSRNAIAVGNDLEKEGRKDEAIESQCPEENVLAKSLQKVNRRTRTIADLNDDSKVELKCQDTIDSSYTNEESVTVAMCTKVVEPDVLQNITDTDIVEENKATIPSQEDSKKMSNLGEPIENVLEESGSALKHQELVSSNTIDKIIKKTRNTTEEDIDKCELSKSESISEETNYEDKPSTSKAKPNLGAITLQTKYNDEEEKSPVLEANSLLITTTKKDTEEINETYETSSSKTGLKGSECNLSLKSQLSHESKKGKTLISRESSSKEKDIEENSKAKSTTDQLSESCDFYNKKKDIENPRTVEESLMKKNYRSKTIEPSATLEGLNNHTLPANSKNIEQCSSSNDESDVIEKCSASFKQTSRDKSMKTPTISIGEHLETHPTTCVDARDFEDNSSNNEKSDIINRARTLRKRGTESPFPANVTNKEPFKHPPRVLSSKQPSPMINQGTNMKRRLRSPLADNAAQSPTIKRPKKNINRKSHSRYMADGTDTVNSTSNTETEVNLKTVKPILLSLPRRPLQKEYAHTDYVDNAAEIVVTKSVCKNISENEIGSAKGMDDIAGKHEKDSVTISSVNKSISDDSKKCKNVQKPSCSPKSVSSNKKVNHIERNKCKLSPDKQKPQMYSPEKSSSCSVLSFAEWLKNTKRTEATHEEQPSESKQNVEDNRRRQNKPIANKLQLDTTSTLVDSETKTNSEVQVIAGELSKALQSSTALKHCAPIKRAMPKTLNTSNVSQCNDTSKTEILTSVAQNLGSMKDITDGNSVQNSAKINEVEAEIATVLPKPHCSEKGNDIYVEAEYTMDLNKHSLSQISSSASVKSPAQPKMRGRKGRRVMVRKIMHKQNRRVTQKNIVNRPPSLSPTKHEKSKSKRSETDILIESMSKEMKDGGIQDLLNDSNHVKRHRISSKRKAQIESTLSNSTDATINTGSDISFLGKAESDTSKSIELCEMTTKKSSVAEVSHKSPHKSPTRRHQHQEKTKKSFVPKQSNKEVLHKHHVLPIEMEKALIDDIEIRNMNTSLLDPLKYGHSKDQQQSTNIKICPFKTPKPPEKTVASPLTSLSKIQSAEDISKLYKNISKKKDTKKGHSINAYSKPVPSFKCRKLSVRLNRNFVKKYLQHLNNENISMTVCIKKAERDSIRNFRKAPRSSTISTSIDTTNTQKNTDDLRIKAVIGSAKLAAMSPQQEDTLHSTGVKHAEKNKETSVCSVQIPSAINKQAAEAGKSGKSMPTHTSPEVPEISDTILQRTNSDTTEKRGAQTVPFTGITSESVGPGPIEFKNEFLDENPCSLDDTILPDTPTLIARAHSITQAAANALSNTIMPTDIRLLTNDPLSSNLYVPSFGVTPTLVDGKGTRMYTFLHPAKYSRNHGNVLLDYCCPNLNGPMPAIDPTRIHAQIQTPVIELPAFVVLTTKVITRAELENNSSTVPAIIRKKAEKLRSSIAIHRNMSASPGASLNVVPPPPIPQQPTPSPRLPPPPQLQQAPQPVLAVIRPPHLAPAPHFSPALNALTKYLPSTTTITAKIRPSLPQPSLPLSLTHPNSNQQTSAISVVAKGPPLLNEMQVNLLRSNLRRFDVLLKKLVQPFDKLNFTERHQIIDNLVMTGKFLPKDLDRSIVLIEEYSKQVNSLQTHQLTPMNSYMSVAAAPSPLTNLPSIQMPPLQPAPNHLSSSAYKGATSQQQVHNTAVRQMQSTVKQHNTTVNTTTVKQRQVPIYDTERNIIGYQLQVITPTPSKPAYTKSPMTTSTSGGMISSSLGANSSNQRKAIKRPAQDSPRVFYATQPLQTSTPKSNLNSMQYPITPSASAKNTQAKSQGSIVTTVRSAGPSSTGTETITTTTMATVKRVTRSRAAGSKIIIVSKSNSNEESILPDVSHQTEIKNERDMEDFVG